MPQTCFPGDSVGICEPALPEKRYQLAVVTVASPDMGDGESLSSIV